MQATASAVDKSGQVRSCVAQLSERGVIGVTGPDAEHLLQGVITQDVQRLAGGEGIYAGLLSPQGKILFDFFVVRATDGVLIDVAAEKAADLINRLTMYRLRAKVAFTDLSHDLSVLVVWGAPAMFAATPGAVVFEDPRLPDLGLRAIVPSGDADAAIAADDIFAATADDWHAHRIALGVPEGGKDFGFGDAFPHEADMDQLAGISFDKGCYVGQEVVSRMQHRGTARKRIVIAKSETAIPAGANLTAGNVQLGSIGSSAGQSALALVRLDRAAEARLRGEALVADGILVEIVKPQWATFDLVPRTTKDEAP